MLLNPSLLLSTLLWRLLKTDREPVCFGAHSSQSTTSGGWSDIEVILKSTESTIRGIISLNLYSARQHQILSKPLENVLRCFSEHPSSGEKKTTAIVNNNANPARPRSVHACILNIYPAFFSHGRRRHVSHGSTQQSAELLWSFFKEREKTHVSRRKMRPKHGCRPQPLTLCLRTRKSTSPWTSRQPHWPLWN